MSENAVSFILSVAALCAVGGSLALALGVASPGAIQLRDFLERRGQVLTLAVAGTAMLGSLYYSEVAHFIPCEFCWYQRIAMYPLAVLLLVATVTRQQLHPRYVVTMAAIGIMLSMYHYQLELFPEQASKCTAGVPCSVRYVEEFGFISIAFMAGCGFLSILLLHLAMYRARHYSEA
ncbi:MAG: disulfide bond formation protein B [Dehalococcoidia bacterium]|nr:disulfide bond formation protein B [Dehalococcoidia bacterium]